MLKKTFAIMLITLSLGIISGQALACGGEASGKHIGNVTHVDPDSNTFTIRDMETASSITFNANDEIIAAAQKARGNVMVNYEEDEEGALVAIGITF